MQAARRNQPREALPLGRALDQFLRASGLSAQVGNWPVFQAWSEALGPELGRRALPVRFTRGELVIEVDSAAHMHELANFTGEQYREQANALLGSETIRRVHFQLKR